MQFFRLRYYLIHLAIAFVISCHSPAKVQKVETQAYKLTPGEVSMVDSVMIKKIQPYKDSVDADMNVVLVKSLVAMEKGQPESKLGNWVSDVCLYLANELYQPADRHPADFAFFNNGGLRGSIPKGPVTKGNVYELMPFENELIILTLQGATVKKIFNFIASKGGVPVAGLRMGIQNSTPVNMYINEMPFDSARTYKVLTSDYLSNGGDQCYFLQDAIARDTVGLKIRDGLIRYMTEKGKRNETLDSELDRRIILTHAK